MNKKVLVVGSVNIDQTVFTNEAPTPGVTLHAESYLKNIGGKGANQAVASFLAGGDVYYICSVGHDDEGEYIANYFRSIHLRHHLAYSPLHTGMAFITTNLLNGENQILVIKGANSSLNLDFKSLFDEKIKESDYLLTQLEIPLETVYYLIREGKRNGLTTILNPAPYKDLDEEIYPYIDYLVPNEHELDLLVKGNLPLEEKAKALLTKGVKNVIVTLGDKGSSLINEKRISRVEPRKVKAIDTTAAGDSYLGAFVTALSEGKDVIEAMKFATIASSITVTRKGAINSLPNRKEIEEI